MLEPDVAIGNVVYLNSGSPGLTIVNYETGAKGELLALVAWYDDTKRMRYERFPTVCLTTVDVRSQELRGPQPTAERNLTG